MSDTGKDETTEAPNPFMPSPEDMQHWASVTGRAQQMMLDYAMAQATGGNGATTSLFDPAGWLQNPTPANWWLDDSEGTWALMMQGAGEEPAGFDRIPDISAGDYVRTNGNYGYACACMKVETDAAQGRITVVHSVRQLPISQCENDTALPAAE